MAKTKPSKPHATTAATSKTPAGKSPAGKSPAGKTTEGRTAAAKSAAAKAAAAKAAKTSPVSRRSRVPEGRYGRRISDPGALRALAHAGRYAILEHLQSGGPATATECAEVAGLSPSACSYHLRLLARHGFVEADATRDDGRERAWRATTTGWWSDVDPETDPAAVQALDSTIVRVMMASSDEKLLAFVDHAAREPEWHDAALFSNSTLVATPAELTDISLALMAVLKPYFSSDRPAGQVPEGARPVHVSIRMAPRLP